MSVRRTTPQFFLSFFVGLWTTFAWAQASSDVPMHFTLDGRLYDSLSMSDPLLDPSVDFRLQILDSTQTCILYEETQSLGTQNTQGYFNLQVGSKIGDPKRASGRDPGHSMAEIFSNRGSLSGITVTGGTACTVNTNTATEKERYVRIVVDPSTRPSEALSPNLLVDSVPNAIVAQSLQGFLPSDFLRAGHDGSAALPGFSADPATGDLSPGNMWYDSVSNEIKYYNGTSIERLGTAGAGISSLTAGTGLTGGTITTSGTIAVDTGVAAGQIVAVQTGGKLPALSGEDLTDLNGSEIQSGTIGGTTAITTSGDIQTSGTVTSARNVLYDHSGVGPGFIGLRAPADMAGANYTMILPPAPGVAGNVLRIQSVSSGNYTMEWATPSSGSVTAVTGEAPISVTSGATPEVSLADGSATGQTLRWGGSSWAAAKLSIGDLVNSFSGSPWPATNCVSSEQVVSWNSATDAFVCMSITSDMVTDALGFTPANAASSGDVRIGGNTVSGVMVVGTNSAHDFALETAGTTRMTVTSTGSVGIGTATPASGLALFADGGADTSDDISITTYSATNSPGFIGYRSRGSAATPQAVLANDVLMNIGGAGHNGTTHGWGGALALIAETNFATSQNTAWRFANVSNGTPVERMRIDSNGRVGIGTATPEDQLHIAQSQVVTFDGTLTHLQQGAMPTLTVQNLANDNIQSPAQLVLKSRSSASAPKAVRLVNVPDGSGSNFAIVTGPNATPSEKVRITSAGNVGIGTTSPSQRLDVVGNINGTQLCIAGDCRNAWPSGGGGGVMSVTAGTGLLVGSTAGASITATGTLNIDTGTTTGKIVQVAASNKLPVIDGSNLTGLTLSQITGTLPISQGGTGETTAGEAINALSPLTTKGDLIAYDGSNHVRLPAGADGKVLKADSSEASGLVWGDAIAADLLSITGTGIVQRNGAGSYSTVSVVAPLSYTGGTLGLNAASGGVVLDGGNTVTATMSVGTNSSHDFGLETGGTTRMTIKADGKIGIGTASPGHLLTVQRNSDDENGIHVINTSTGGTAVASYYGSNSVGNMQFGIASTGHTWGGNISRNRAFLWADAATDGILQSTESTDPILFATNTTERMRIAGNGNIGIRTTSPGVALDVQGASPQIRAMNSSAGTAILAATTYGGTDPTNAANLNLSRWRGSLGAPVVPSSGDHLAVINAYGGGDPATWAPVLGAKILFTAEENFASDRSGSGIGFYTQPAGSTASLVERMHISNHGGVGIGVTATIDNFQVRGKTGFGAAGIQSGQTTFYPGNVAQSYFHIENKNDNSLRISAGASPGTTDLVTFQNTGNVGIGTSSPTAGARLDISGTGAASSSIIIPRDTTLNRPGTGVPGMMRYNTTDNKFEFFENNAWVNLGSGGGGAASSVAAGAGTAGAPSISFSADADTGFYSPSSNMLGITTAGSLKWSIDDKIESATAGGARISGSSSAASPSFSFNGDSNTGMFQAAADTLAFSTAGAERMRIDATGNVGIGTSSPGYKLTVISSSTQTASGNVAAAFNYMYADPSSSSAARFIGQYNGVENGGATAAITGEIIGQASYSKHNSSTALGKLSGSWSGVNNTSTGAVATAVGVQGEVSNDSTGSITTAMGLQASVKKPGAGAITNAYGLYVGDVKGSDAWSLYASDATAPSYFAGNVGIGTNDPNKNLEVSASDASTEIRVVNTNSTTTRGPKVSIRNYTSGQGGYPFMSMLNSRGNSTTTAAILEDDTLGSFEYVGVYDNLGGYGTAADVRAEAEGDFTTGSTPGRLIFRTTPTGDDEPTSRMVIDSNGNVAIGAGVPDAFVHLQKNQNGNTSLDIRNTVNDTAAEAGMTLYNNVGPMGWLMVGSSTFGGGDNFQDRITLQSSGSANGVNIVADGTGDIRFMTTSIATERMRIANDGSVGIGTESPDRILHVYGSAPIMRMQSSSSSGSAATTYIEFFGANGVRTGFIGDGSGSNANIHILSESGAVQAQSGANTCTYSSGTSWSCSSDERLKDQITPLQGSLEKILQLQGVSYHWRDSRIAQKEHIGFIAQDVEKVFPQMVETDEETGMKRLDYSAMVSPLVESTKEIYGMCKKTDERVARHEEEIRKMSRELASVREDFSQMKKHARDLEAENAGLKKRLELIEKKLGLR